MWLAGLAVSSLDVGAWMAWELEAQRAGPLSIDCEDAGLRVEGVAVEALRDSIARVPDLVPR